MKNEYAFPAIGDGPNAPHFAPGLTIRDYFAAAALQGDMAVQNEVTGAWANTVEDNTLRERAEFFYRFADAMLAAREKARGEGKGASNA